MASIGGRKFALGMVYLIGCFGLLGISTWNGTDAATITALAAAEAGMAPAVAAIIWGNVQEHRAKNGG